MRKPRGAQPITSDRKPPLNRAASFCPVGCPVFRSVLPSRELAKVALVMVQEIEGPHAEAVIVPMKMQSVQVIPALAQLML